MIRMLFLGTGTSTGVPTIGCDCRTCLSTDEKDKRTRSSVLVSWEEGGEPRSVLVDACTDLRFQALRFHLKRVDAVLFTHSHADHMHGIDDLRSFNFIQRRSIPCYGSADTMNAVKNRFDYIFNPEFSKVGGGTPRLTLNAVGDDFELFGLKISVLPVKHGESDVFGYRFGRIAYITDVNRVPDATLQKVRGSEIVVVGAVQRKPHATHFGLSEALEFLKKSGARKGYITHMNHDLMHGEVSAELPDDVFLAYDGLSLTAGAE